jgi:hypothetical protein
MVTSTPNTPKPEELPFSVSPLTAESAGSQSVPTSRYRFVLHLQVHSTYCFNDTSWLLQCFQVRLDAGSIVWCWCFIHQASSSFGAPLGLMTIFLFYVIDTSGVYGDADTLWNVEFSVTVTHHSTSKCQRTV